MNSFFFMGCWNEDRCDTMDYRTAVVKQIMSETYAFGVIAGDNIYQQRGVYHLKTLDYGFQLLGQTNVPLYTLLGNHDVHTKAIFQAHLNLVQQKKIIMPRHCYTVMYPNLRLIVIDTNVLTSKVNREGTYTRLQREYPDFFSLPTATELLDYLENELAKPFKGWTLVVGHEPFLSIKLTKIDRIKITYLNHYKRLTELLSASPRTVYLCADVHTFQAMNVPIANTTQSQSIPQVVVGTGGAFPDRSPDEHTLIPLPMSIYPESGRGHGPKRNLPHTFKMEGASPSYGYASVSYSAKQLFIRFHPLKGCSEGQSEMTFEYKKDRLVLIQRIPVKKTHCPAKPAGDKLCRF